MSLTPRAFRILAIVALLWNLLGLSEVISDLRMSAADIALLPPQMQEMIAARPLWSVVASLVAVVGGSVGCLGLILHRRWSLGVLAASLVGVILQDAGLALVARSAGGISTVVLVMQGLVLAIAVALVAFAKTAQHRGWLR
jgi:hypothetical protein